VRLTNARIIITIIILPLGLYCVESHLRHEFLILLQPVSTKAQEAKLYSNIVLSGNNNYILHSSLCVYVPHVSNAEIDDMNLLTSIV